MLIPKAEDLDRYEKIEKGLASRILKLYEEDEKDNTRKNLLSILLIIILFSLSVLFLFHNTSNVLFMIGCFVAGLGCLIVGIILSFKFFKK